MFLLTKISHIPTLAVNHFNLPRVYRRQSGALEYGAAIFLSCHKIFVLTRRFGKFRI